MNMVPQKRLIFCMALVGLPLAVCVIAYPDTGPLLWLALALLAVIAVIDGLLGLGRLRGIRAELPDIVRLTRDRDGEIPIRIINPDQQSLRLRIGVPLPMEVECDEETLAVQIPGGYETLVYNWECRPRRRGKYPIDRCYFERSSPLGLWAMRGYTVAESELRVYPNLRSERRNLAALFLNRGGIGVHALRQIGKGRDFEKLRDYIPGDSYEDIHWKASAKRGQPVTKVFQIERTQEVYVVMDASRLSARRAAPTDPENFESQLERFLVAAMVTGLAAERQGDNFGLIMFSDRVKTFIRARNGKTHYGVCRDALYTAETDRVNPDFEELATFIRTRLTRRALLVFLTNLDDPVLSESFLGNMQLVARQHLVMTNMIVPPDVAPIFSQPETTGLTEIYRQLGGHYRWQELRELERALKRLGVGFHMLANENLCVDIVSQYMAIKQRQIL